MKMQRAQQSSSIRGGAAPAGQVGEEEDPPPLHRTAQHLETQKKDGGNLTRGALSRRSWRLLLAKSVAAELDGSEVLGRTSRRAGELLRNDLKRRVWDFAAPPKNPLEESRVLPRPFARLLEGKLVCQTNLVLSKWHGRKVEIEPPVPAETHMLNPRRGRGSTVFTDGSVFVDAGVGFSCGPNRYRASLTERAHPERLRELGLTNQDTGLSSEEYWVVESHVAEHKKQQRFLARARLVSEALIAREPVPPKSSVEAGFIAGFIAARETREG